MKILIMGASGSGTTTLGKELATVTEFKHLDVDDYYWKATNPPFQFKEESTERQQRLQSDFEAYEDVIISGSLVSWGRYWLTVFDLVVLVTLDKNVRLERLQQREIERYGTALETDPEIKARSQAFLDWATRYDDLKFTGRSMKLHRDWLQHISCEVIEIDSINSVAYNVSQLLEKC